MMKDNLFELLLSLVEKTLSQLKEKEQSLTSNNKIIEEKQLPTTDKKVTVPVQIFKSANRKSTRVFIKEEQMKLTKASYQFLKRLESMGLITSQSIELIINRLFFSESRFVSLQETKWTIRNTLASGLDNEGLAFLDLILYSKEDGAVLH